MPDDTTILALVSAVFIASLLGSVHCAGMCGGLLLFAVGARDERKRVASWAPHAGYHLGRGLSYTALGVGAGSLGAALDLGGSLVGVQRAATWFAGAAIVVFGLVTLAQAFGVRLRRARENRAPGRFRRLVESGYAFALGLTPVRRATMIGLLTPLLPCGWLYAFVITASGTGNATWGGVTMLVFWSGTLPLMLSIGVGMRALTAPLQRLRPALTSLLIVGVGLWTVLGRGVMPATAAEAMLAERPESVAESIDAAQTTEPDACPLCAAGDSTHGDGG